MNNVTGMGGGTGRVCRENKRGSSPSSNLFLTTSSSFHSPPLSRSPNPPPLPRPLSCRTHCRRSEREEEDREAEGETGVGCVEVHEHAERRARGRAMTAMLSPKIRQTRRGRTQFAFTSTASASTLHLVHLMRGCMSYALHVLLQIYGDVIKCFFYLIEFRIYTRACLQKHSSPIPSIPLTYISEWSGRFTYAWKHPCTLAFYYSWPALLVPILLRGVRSISCFIAIRLVSAAAVCAHTSTCTVCVCICSVWMYE